MRSLVALLMIASAGCGALGGSGGGASNLPVSGSGPFLPLDPSDSRWAAVNAPFVLQDSAADLDHPFVLARGDRLSVWVAATRMKRTDLERADADALANGFGDLSPVLVADQPWEQGTVDAPSLIAGDPIVASARWILSYAGADAIGFATSANGDDWVKAPGPVLTANGREEGDRLSSPAVVRIDDRVRVYYWAAGAIWAAEASYDDVALGRATTWTRIDGDPNSAVRDPMLRAPSWAQSIDGINARVTQTPAGRLRHDLYFSVSMIAYVNATATSGCGFASSFTGDRFEVAGAPIVPLMRPTRSPAETPYGTGALLLYIEQSGARQSVAAATTP